MEALYHLTVWPTCACLECAAGAEWWRCNEILLGTRRPVARYTATADCRVEQDEAIRAVLARHPGQWVVAA